VSAPIKAIEATLFNHQIKRMAVRPPIFILGHWRSGTTFLHYLLAMDKSFQCVTNFHTFVPGASITGGWVAKKFIEWQLPEKRPVDGMELHPDLPQEEEFAISNLSPYSFYHGFVFPKELDKLFKNYVLFEDVPTSTIETWKEIYFSFMQKMQFRQKDKTLLLKNPMNTGRVRLLLEMFPDAKFIYIHRDAKEVKQSTFRLFSSVINQNGLQHVDSDELKASIEVRYEKLLQAYNDQKPLIPSNHLIEVSYEELTTAPLATTRAIYDHLGLTTFDLSEPAFKTYIDSQKDYKTFKNKQADKK
jgi:hypothetical protein